MERITRRDLFAIGGAGLVGYGIRSLSPEQTPVARAIEPDNDYEVRKGDETIRTMPDGTIWVLQADGEPLEGGNRRRSWHDTNPNSALITIVHTRSDWWLGNGADVAEFRFDRDCPQVGRSFADALSRAAQYATQVQDLKLSGTGELKKKFESAPILNYPYDKGQGE